LLVIIYKPEVTIFVITVGYALSGPVWWLCKVINKKRGHQPDAKDLPGGEK